MAAHAHTTAAESHGKADHLTAHELSRQALEHSQNAWKQSEQLVEEAKKPTKE
jgi:LmbE family N-acetylglucosaminyl deacetylase